VWFIGSQFSNVYETPSVATIAPSSNILSLVEGREEGVTEGEMEGTTDIVGANERVGRAVGIDVGRYTMSKV
jgi:hypothetical protein